MTKLVIKWAFWRPFLYLWLCSLGFCVQSFRSLLTMRVICLIGSGGFRRLLTLWTVTTARWNDTPERASSKRIGAVFAGYGATPHTVSICEFAVSKSTQTPTPLFTKETPTLVIRRARVGSVSGTPTVMEN